MTKLVILRLEDGHFEQGFSQVTIEIRENSKNNQDRSQILDCQLPPEPQIPSLCQRRQQKYHALLYSPRAGFKASATERVSISPNVIAEVFAKDFADCSKYTQSLKECLNSWVSPIREQLQTFSFNPQDEIHCVIQTQKMTDARAKDIIHKLPWHLSNLFPENCFVEFSLSFIESKGRPDSDSIFRLKRLNRVKFLCILGDSSSNINNEADRRLIRKLPGAYAIFLRQPTHEELKSYLQERWDIIFFSGHSETSKDGQTGWLKINDLEKPLDIQKIRRDMQMSISQGLQLVFFNSCDGLGLARQLADLNIPQMLVWTEPVPDCVAQQFLNSFLKSFADAEGKSLYRSLQEARQDLENMEQELKLPGVSWLPIIYDNLAEESITWQTLRGHADPEKKEERDPYRQRIPRRQSLPRRLSSWMGRLLNHDYQNKPRDILLDKVEEYWVEGVLKTSLHIQETIELGLDELSSRMAWETPNQQRRNLPPGTRAIDKFDELENKRTLVILGEPGAGKTSALLEMALELLDDARQDGTLPIPVVLNLSSWSSERLPQPFADWLIGELNRTYDLSQSQVQTWLKNERLLLLLDGLDEIKVYDLDRDPVIQNVEQTVKQQELCVRAINQFMREYGQIGLVVCSRIDEYEALSEKLQFNAAIYLNSLTKAQIYRYLDDAGKELAVVRELRKEYPKFLKIFESPLMLNFIAVAYQGKSREELGNLECLLKELEKNSSEIIEEKLLENLEQELMKTYVLRRFETKCCNFYADLMSVLDNKAFRKNKQDIG